MSAMSEERKRNVKIQHELWIKKYDLEALVEAVDLELIQHWHGLGQLDSTMARSLAVNTERIKELREKIGLKPNEGNPKDWRFQDYMKGYSDRELAERWGLIIPSIVRWRKRRNLKENVGPVKGGKNAVQG